MTSLLLAVGAQGVAVCLVALLLYKLSGKKSAAMRHQICGICTLTLLGLPLSALITPTLGVRPAFTQPVVSSGELPQTPMVVATPPRPKGDRVPIQSLLPIGWTAGAVALLLRRSARHLGMRRALRTKTQPFRNAEDLGLAEGNVRILLSDLASRSGPFVATYFRPTIVLPTDALDWPSAQTASVLAHELAHVERKDCWWQEIAALAVAVHWVNPLAWLVNSLLRREAELAADDRALSVAASRDAYASHLVQVVRQISTKPLDTQVAMATGLRLEERVIRIMSKDTNRTAPRARDRVVHAAIFLAVSALLIPCKEAAAIGVPLQGGRLHSRPFKHASVKPAKRSKVRQSIAQTPATGSKQKAGLSTTSRYRRRVQGTSSMPIQGLATRPSARAPLSAQTQATDISTSEEAHRKLLEYTKGIKSTAPEPKGLTEYTYDKPTAVPGKGGSPTHIAVYVDVGDERFEDLYPVGVNEAELKRINDKYWAIAKRKGVDSIKFTIKN